MLGYLKAKAHDAPAGRSRHRPRGERQLDTTLHPILLVGDVETVSQDRSDGREVAQEDLIAVLPRMVAYTIHQLPERLVLGPLLGS